ncbi:hypothetical protein ACH470_03920 [Streptomyces bottropensis]|uniref:hypothetical protein n=1 Tax=Streptomyces bottropensis TaxID=42235 RepID=UPI0037AE00AE
MPQTVQLGHASGRRLALGVTALRGGRGRLTRRPTPYLVVGGLFWLVTTLAYWRVPLCCDAGLHAAVVERLRWNLPHPAHPTAALPGAGSPHYSPYALAQGVLARLTGLSGWSLVKLAGPVNLLVLLTGLGRFVRVLTPRAWAPVLALLFTTLLWGTGTAPWSGGPGLMSMTTDLGHPSAFALGLMFWAWAWTGVRARGGGSGRRARYVGPSGLGGLGAYAGLGALYGLILLVHPMTAAAAVAGAMALVAAWQHGWRAPLAGRWALTATVTAAVAVAWPSYDVLSSATATGTSASAVPPVADVAGHLWPALLGLPALWARGRGSRRDPLVLVCAAECLVAAYGWMGGHSAYGRVAEVAAVSAQVALGVELAAPRPWRWARRALGGAAVAGACAGLLMVHAGAVVPAAFDPVGFAQPPRWPSYAWAARHVRAGEVLLTDGYRAERSLPGYGVNMVAPPWSDPALPEAERGRRLTDVRVYLDPASTRERRGTVARRYGVRWLLLTRWRRVPGEAVVVDWSPRTGEVLARIAP